MYSFAKITLVFLAATSFSFISCKGKPGKASIVGTWAYKEFIYTSSKRYQELNSKQQQRKKEEDDQEAKATVAIFKKDKTYSIAAKRGDKAELITGTYEINEAGELVSKETGKSRTEKLKIILVEKNILQLQDPSDGIIIVFERVK